MALDHDDFSMLELGLGRIAAALERIADCQEGILRATEELVENTDPLGAAFGATLDEQTFLRASVQTWE